MPNRAAAVATTIAASRSPHPGSVTWGSDMSKVKSVSSEVVIAPAPAATSGAKSRSHSEPRPVGWWVRASEMTSAAATGVPKRAPMVAEVASTTHSAPGAAGATLRPSQ